MSKLLKISLIIIGIIILTFLSFYELRKIDFFEGKNYFDFVAKNNTWDSEFSKNLFYKKGNEIEYNFFLKKDINGYFSIDTSKLDKIIKDYEILLNDKKINKSDLKKIKITDKRIITFKGKAISDKTTNDKGEKIEDLIDIEILEEIKNIKEEDSNKYTTGTINNVSISNKEFSSNINNLLIISGNGLNNVKYVNIGGISFTPKYQNNNLYIGIDKNTFASGDFFILFQLKNNSIISYPSKIKFTYSDKLINISSITPREIKNDIDRYIVLQGNNFSKVIRVQLSNNLVLKETNFKIINDNVITIKIPKGLNPGEYFVNFMLTNGIFELNNSKFVVTK